MVPTGTEETVCRLVREYSDMLLRLACTRLSSVSDAEDAVQEVFLRLYTADPDFESEEHRRRWLIRVALNYCKNELRRFGRRRQVSMEDVEIPFEQPEQGELFSVVMTLPEKYRTALYLFYYEDYTVKEIAEALEIKISAATTRLSRAREALRRELKEVGYNG